MVKSNISLFVFFLILFATATFAGSFSQTVTGTKDSGNASALPKAAVAVAPPKAYSVYVTGNSILSVKGFYADGNTDFSKVKCNIQVFQNSKSLCNVFSVSDFKMTSEFTSAKKNYKKNSSSNQQMISAFRGTYKSPEIKLDPKTSFEVRATLSGLRPAYSGGSRNATCSYSTIIQWFAWAWWPYTISAPDVTMEVR